jgi:hypothetical protein
MAVTAYFNAVWQFTLRLRSTSEEGQNEPSNFSEEQSATEVVHKKEMTGIRVICAG